MGVGSWFRKLLGMTEEPSSSNPSEQSAGWLAADDPGNPFGVELLDLMSNVDMISASEDPDIAARAVGWRPGAQREVSVELQGTELSCNLRYPVPADLPDGLVYRPEVMEDKWVLAYRDGRVAAARSWTGETKAVAHTRRDGDALVITSIIFADDSGFEAFGDPVCAFDWLIRTHALESRIPFPASKEGANLLAEQPLAGFSLYGRHMFCAAPDYSFDAPEGQLYSDGDLIAAVAEKDPDQALKVLSEGAPVDAPCRFNQGATALYLAIQLESPVLQVLIDAGADVNAATRRGSTPLMAAVAAGAERSTLDVLVKAGAGVNEADEMGFAPIHVAAQFGRTEMIGFLEDYGANLRAKTERGLTPLHVAAGIGKRGFVEELLARGLDPTTPSPLGDPLAIAEENGQSNVVELLRSL